MPPRRRPHFFRLLQLHCTDPRRGSSWIVTKVEVGPKSGEANNSETQRKCVKYK